MKSRDCKHCKVIKTLSGPKYWCTKHNKKCGYVKNHGCLGMELTVEAKNRWKIKIAKYRKEGN